MSKQNKRISEEIDEKRLQEHKDAIQLAEWRKNLPCKAVCDYLDKNLPGWREEPEDDDDDDDSDEDNEMPPHCCWCYNMNMNLNITCFVCDKIYCKSHSVLGDNDMYYCSKFCFLNH